LLSLGRAVGSSLDIVPETLRSHIEPADQRIDNTGRDWAAKSREAREILSGLVRDRRTE